MKTILIAHLIISAFFYFSAISFLTSKLRSHLKDKNKASFFRMARANFGLLPLFCIPIFNFLVYIAILINGEEEVTKQLLKYVDE